VWDPHLRTGRTPRHRLSISCLEPTLALARSTRRIPARAGSFDATTGDDGGGRGGPRTGVHLPRRPEAIKQAKAACIKARNSNATVGAIGRTRRRVLLASYRRPTSKRSCARQ